MNQAKAILLQEFALEAHILSRRMKDATERAAAAELEEEFRRMVGSSFFANPPHAKDGKINHQPSSSR